MTQNKPTTTTTTTTTTTPRRSSSMSLSCALMYASPQQQQQQQQPRTAGQQLPAPVWQTTTMTPARNGGTLRNITRILDEAIALLDDSLLGFGDDEEEEF